MSVAIDIESTPFRDGSLTPPMFDELMRDWDGEQVVVRYDRPTGTWMFVCVHSTVRGPAGGGTRMKVYESLAAGLQDGMRLAGAMTLKMAGVGVPFGGGKAVLAVSTPLENHARRDLLLRYGELVESLGGRYHTGPDVNTTVADMDVIGERTSHVFCRSVERGGSGDPGPFTARGVFEGIRASVRHVFGSADLAGRSVLVQGVGDVGARLAELLAENGARVLVSDVDRTRMRAIASRLAVDAVPPERAVETECDVFAPCAIGGVLNEDSIPRLRCRIVAGSANNQLATPADAARLRGADILYAPDYLINAGGVLNAIGLELLGWTRDEVDHRLAGIDDTLSGLFHASDTEGISTHEAAERLARARLAG